MKRMQHGADKKNGVQYLQHQYQKTHKDIILLDEDLKNLILIVIGKSDKGTNIVKFEYDDELIEYCCCIPKESSKNKHFRNVHEIVIHDGDLHVTFVNAYPVQYDFIKLTLVISLEEVITIY